MNATVEGVPLVPVGRYFQFACPECGCSGSYLGAPTRWPVCPLAACKNNGEPMYALYPASYISTVAKGEAA